MTATSTRRGRAFRLGRRTNPWTVAVLALAPLTLLSACVGGSDSSDNDDSVQLGDKASLTVLSQFGDNLRSRRSSMVSAPTGRRSIRR